MRTSNKGIELIIKWEGLKLKPYLCSALVPTIGYGSTRYEDGTRVKLTDPPITKERALELFKNTLRKYELEVDAMTRDDISQNHFDALVSFCYNVGANNLKVSTLLKKVNRNPHDNTIFKEFIKWIYANGKPLKGLRFRREAEAKLYYGNAA